VTTPFLATLFHELRGPITTARSWLFLLRRAPRSGVQTERALEAIDRQLNHLARLVDDLLDVSRIREGKLRLLAVRLDLAEVARRAIEDHGVLFAAKEIELRAEIPADPLWIQGDSARLAQVLRNLLQNASKFTPRGGHATLTLEADVSTGMACLRLRDTGQGFDPALRERLFECFEQAEAAVARSENGLGLGLALVKALVELHGGTVEAQSDGRGTGAEFVVCLPSDTTIRAMAQP
jgi:signal transduction histidine kinase